MAKPRKLTLTINSEHAGKTVDALLRHVLHVSGSAVRRAKRIPEGITLDYNTVYTNVLVQEGQTLSIQVGGVSCRQAVSPVSGPIFLAYEDEDLLVLDKQAPLAVHPGPGNPDRTLANYLQSYYQAIGLRADFHPVNRLDRGTSGLMVVAKHAYAHERIRQGLHSGVFRREYLAVCEGVPSPSAGSIDLPIGRVPGAVLQREVRPDGAIACTHYRMLSTDGQRSMISLILETGRTHQIRVHMKSIGCPVVGDFLYGKEEPAIPDRFALHSAKLEFCHPITGRKIALSSPLPKELTVLLSEELLESKSLQEDHREAT